MQRNEHSPFAKLNARARRIGELIQAGCTAETLRKGGASRDIVQEAQLQEMRLRQRQREANRRRMYGK